MRYIAVRFTPELYEEVKDLSREEHRSLNGTVLEAVERYVRQQRARHRREAADR